MSLALDTRQRAMLQEMGVRVWLPQPTVPEAPVMASVKTPVAIENRATKAGVTKASAIKPLKITDSEPNSGALAPSARSAQAIAEMDWPTLTQAVTDCHACALCTGRRAPVFGAPDLPQRADWLVLGEPPDAAEERAGQAYVDQAGQLLDNMLRALGLSRRSPGQNGTAPAQAAYVSNVVKCRPAVARNPTPQELASCEHFLRREMALVQPKVILALGRYAAQTLLQGSVPGLATIPLGKLRGQVYRYQDIPVVVSYPPSYLLRSPLDKALAWADLCRARALLEG